MIQKLLVTAGLLALVSAEDAVQADCEFCIDNQCYIDSIFTEKNLRRYGAHHIPAFDMTENILYYTNQFKSLYIDVDKRDTSEQEIKYVPDVTYVVGHTVDQKTRQVYIWAIKNGRREYNLTYKYDPSTNKTETLNITKESIKEMHFKEKLYYTLKDQNSMFAYDNGIVNSVSAFDGHKINQFVIDKPEDVYATTDNGVYKYKKDGAQVSLVTYKKYWLSIDKDENLYFLAPDVKTVLKLDYSTERIVEAGAMNTNLDFTDRFLFDKHNNILYHGLDKYANNKFGWIHVIQKGQCITNIGSGGKKIIVKTP